MQTNTKIFKRKLRKLRNRKQWRQSPTNEQNSVTVCVSCLVVSNCLQSHGLCPPGSSVHGILQAKNTGMGFQAFLQGIFSTQGLNLGLQHCRQILYSLSLQERNTKITGRRKKKKIMGGKGILWDQTLVLDSQSEGPWAPGREGKISKGCWVSKGAAPSPLPTVQHGDTQKDGRSLEVCPPARHCTS